MAILSQLRKKQHLQRRRIGGRSILQRVNSVISNKRFFRVFIVFLAFIALGPPIYFHLKLRRSQQVQLVKCSWLKNPPLVCAHGGDSLKHLPNTSIFWKGSFGYIFGHESRIAAYNGAVRSQVDCVEIDISRSSDGVLLALHDRDLQRISGNSTSKVGHLSMKEIEELNSNTRFIRGSCDEDIITFEEALHLVSTSVRQVIIDAKVGPPSFENGLAEDILSIVQKTQCRNCIVWAKSDTLARNVIRLSSDATVGYIVMKDPSTRARSNLLRMAGAEVVGVYHELIDEKTVRVLHGMNKKVYAWTVDDVKSMKQLLYKRVDAIVTNKFTQLQSLMQDIKKQCFEEGFSFAS